MHKKCLICDDKASLMIKDTNDYYCEECAKESFDDILLLVKVEEQAKKLKEIVEKYESQDQYKEPINPEDIVDQYEEVKDRIKRDE